MKLLTIILLAVLSVACSNSTLVENKLYKEIPDRLALKEHRYVTLNEIRYKQLPEVGDIELNVSSSNDIIRLDSNYSYVEGIKLPVSSSDIGVSVYSPIDDNGVFLPSVLVLDENFKFLDFLGTSNNFYTPKSLFKAEGYYSEYRLPQVYPNGKNPSYLVFFTDVEKLNLDSPKPLRVINDMAIRAGDIEANILDASNSNIQYRKTGRIYLEIELEHFSNPYERVKDQKVISNIPSSFKWSESKDDESKYYYEMIKNFVRKGYFSKAATYMEEAENKGVEGVRELFVLEVNNY